MSFQITLMGVVIVIAIITGIYITFGGQTAVIFTDLLQGFILLFAGLFLFALGISYLGGFDVFWNILPTEWKMPLAKFNEPSSFNFVGIFWQDGVAGSIGFLFLNFCKVDGFCQDPGRRTCLKPNAFETKFFTNAFGQLNAGGFASTAAGVMIESVV